MPVTRGTVALTNGSKAVVGTGTKWISDCVRPGALFALVDEHGVIEMSEVYSVAEVGSETSITLDQEWQGETASGLAYAIADAGGEKMSSDVYNLLASKIREIEEFLEKGDGGTEPGDFVVLGDSGKVDTALLETNTANGVAKLNASGQMPYSYLPDEVKQSGKNYLHNWYFYSPVKTRGAGPWTVSRKYTIDRWLMYGLGQIAADTNGVVLNANGGGNLYLEQTLERLSGFLGRTVTFSIRVPAISGGGGRIGIWLGNDNYSFPSEEAPAIATADFTSAGIISCTGQVPVPTDRTHLKVFIKANSGTEIALAAAKFEVGSVSTLKFDGPADYSEELNLCGRFCQKFSPEQRSRMVTYGTDYLDFILPVSQQMRTVPTIESGTFKLCNTQGGELSAEISATSFVSSTPNLFIRCTSAAHGQTDAVLKTNDGVILSADM